MPFKLKMHNIYDIFEIGNFLIKIGGKRYFPLGMVPINGKKIPQEKSMMNCLKHFDLDV